MEEAPFSAPAAAGLGFSVLMETAFVIPAWEVQSDVSFWFQFQFP